MQSTFGRRHQCDGHHHVACRPTARKFQPEQIVAQEDIAIDVDVVVMRSKVDQLFAFRPEQLTRLDVGQSRQPILESQLAPSFHLGGTFQFGNHDETPF